MTRLSIIVAALALTGANAFAPSMVSTRSTSTELNLTKIRKYEKHSFARKIDRFVRFCLNFIFIEHHYINIDPNRNMN